MYVHHSSSGETWKLIGVCLIGGPVALLWGLGKLNQKRLLENTPTSKIRSAAMGLVELMGMARQRTPMQSPVTKQACCWWRCIVEELRSNGKNSHWATVKDVQSQDFFFIEDATGRVLIDPLGAEYHVLNITYELNASTRSMIGPVLNSWGLNDMTWFGGTRRLRLRELSIPEKAPLFVLGELINTGQQHIEDRQARFRERLQAVKFNPRQMSQADTNHDGQVDADEWDAFRNKLEEDFLREEMQRQSQNPNVELLLIRQPTEKPFIISTKGPDELGRAWAWQAPLGIAAGIALSGLGIWLALQQHWDPWIPLALLGGGFGAGFYFKLKGGSTSWVSFWR
ncbi:MAG: GIDE domain-containing protein [Elusimicrobiota bacterium]|jgi:hypothetical protein